MELCDSFALVESLSIVNNPIQVVVIPCGGIDFGDSRPPVDADQPSESKLLVEERRIVGSIAGNENLEIQWRLATLKEAKGSCNPIPQIPLEKSLIKTVVDESMPFSQPQSTT